MTEIEALTKRRKGEALSSTERTSLSRLGSSLPAPVGVVRLAVREASAIEWKARTMMGGDDRAQESRDHVHEDAVRKHLAAMGPDRAAALLEDFGGVDWDSRKLSRRIPTRRIGREEFARWKKLLVRTERWFEGASRHSRQGEVDKEDLKWARRKILGELEESSGN